MIIRETRKARLMRGERCAAIPMVAILATLATACGGQAPQPSGPTIRSYLAPAKRPQLVKAKGANIQILTPARGQKIDGAFTARVRLSHFALGRPRLGAKPIADEGYLEFSLDGGRYDQPRYSGANGRAALRLAVNGYYSPAYQPTITYRRIPAGHHTLAVALANRDGTTAGVMRRVTFTVR